MKAHQFDIKKTIVLELKIRINDGNFSEGILIFLFDRNQDTLTKMASP